MTMMAALPGCSPGSVRRHEGAVPPAARGRDAGADRRRGHRGDRRGATRADPDPLEPARRIPVPAAVHTGWGRRAADPEGAVGSFFPSLLEPCRRVDKALWG